MDDTISRARRLQASSKRSKSRHTKPMWNSRADELISHFRTTSLYFQIDPADREAFEDDDRRRIDAAGGTVRFLSATVLMTARRSQPQ